MVSAAKACMHAHPAGIVPVKSRMYNYRCCDSLSAPCPSPSVGAAVSMVCACVQGRPTEAATSTPDSRLKWDGHMRRQSHVGGNALALAPESPHSSRRAERPATPDRGLCPRCRRSPACSGPSARASSHSQPRTWSARHRPRAVIPEAGPAPAAPTTPSPARLRPPRGGGDTASSAGEKASTVLDQYFGFLRSHRSADTEGHDAERPSASNEACLSCSIAR